MPQLVPLRNGCSLIHVNQPNIAIEHFDPTWWQRAGKIISTGQGRGEVWFLNEKNEEWVLRRYRRGGLIGKFNHYFFFYQPIHKTRPYLELALLEKMCELGLPVPTPIGGLVQARGIGYQAWLLTRRISGARDLFELLQHAPLPNEIWYAIGKTIRQFHNHGIFHSDLNCHNIMLDHEQHIWLIDFDKCDQRTVAASWQQSNLERLHRSLHKESGKHANFHWHSQAWQLLLDGYQHD